MDNEGWVDVNERLPEPDDGTVFECKSAWNRTTKAKRVTDSDGEVWWANGEQFNFILHSVSHWRLNR